MMSSTTSAKKVAGLMFDVLLGLFLTGLLMSVLLPSKDQTNAPKSASAPKKEVTGISNALPVQGTANLSIDKAASSDTAVVGSIITYTLTVMNAGPDDAVNVVVTDVLPSGVSFVSCSTSGGVNGQCSESMGTVTATFDSLAANDTAIVTIDVIVNASAAMGGSLANTASVTSDTFDPDTSDNTSNTVEVAVFDCCLQDDSDPSKVLVFNSFSGDYIFCCGTNSRTGTGRVSRRGMIVSIADGRIMKGDVDKATRRGNASISAGSVSCTIMDRNTLDNTCVCSLPDQ